MKKKYYILETCPYGEFENGKNPVFLQPCDASYITSGKHILSGEVEVQGTVEFKVSQEGVAYDMIGSFFMYLLSEEVVTLFSKNKVTGISYFAPTINGKKVFQGYKYKGVIVREQVHGRDLHKSKVLEEDYDNYYEGLYVDESKVHVNIFLIGYLIVVDEKVKNLLVGGGFTNINLIPVEEYKIPILEGVNDDAYLEWKKNQ